MIPYIVIMLFEHIFTFFVHLILTMHLIYFQSPNLITCFHFGIHYNLFTFLFKEFYIIPIYF